MLKLMPRSHAINWIAIFAILFSALAPGMSQAFTRAEQTSQLIAICTSTGMKYVKAPSAIAQDTELESSSDSTECSYCQATQHLVCLLSNHTQRQHVAHIAFQSTPVQSPAYAALNWRLPQSRAPPTLNF